MKVQFGLKNVHIAPFTYDESGYTYETPIKLPGAVKLSINPAGEDVDFYGDNVKYFTTSLNQGYEGDLEIALLTDEVRTKVFGEKKDSNGAYFESSKDEVKGFALGFEISGDTAGRRFWYYNVVSSRPKNEAQTNNNGINVSTDTLTIKAMPRLTDDRIRTYLTATEENATKYNSFFDEVYEYVQTA